MDSKKINQLATNVAPSVNDLTVIGDATTGELKKITLSQISSLFGSSGSVSSVAMTTPTGLTISGSPITTSGTLAVTFTAGYSIPTTAKQSEWDLGYAERLKWDGGSAGLVASTARASLGLVIGTDVLAYRTFGSAANNATADFATFAQGVSADTAFSLRLTGASLPLSISGNIISIAESSTTISGFLSSTNFNVFNGKQAALNGTGFVKASGTTISYDNSTYALDNAVVHLIGTETIGGTKTFSDTIKNNGGIFLQNASSNSLAGYMNLGGLTNGVRFTSGGGIANYFTLPSATGYTYTFPNATGTLALTSDLSAYLPLAGGTLTGPLTTSNINIGIGGTEYPDGQLIFTTTTSGSYVGIGTQMLGAATMYFDHRATGNTGSFVFRNGSGGGNTLMTIKGGGNVLIGTTDDGGRLVSYTTTAATQFKAAGTAPAITFSNTVLSPTIGGVLGVCTAASQFFTGTASSDMVLANQFSVGALIFGTNNLARMRIKASGVINITSIPTSSAGLVSGDVYSSAGVLMIV